jgi:spore coat protein U-like protein
LAVNVGVAAKRLGGGTLAPAAARTRIDEVSQLARLLIAISFAAAAWLVPTRASAQTCSFTSTPTNVSFGTYNGALGTPNDSSTTFQFTCSNNAPKVVDLSPGGGTFATRQMSFGAEKLDYNLFTTAARTQIWGDGTPPSVTMSFRRDTLVTIYGRIPTGQFPAAGTYTDTITVTVNF